MKRNPFIKEATVSEEADLRTREARKGGWGVWGGGGGYSPMRRTEVSPGLMLWNVQAGTAEPLSMINLLRPCALSVLSFTFLCVLASPEPF